MRSAAFVEDKSNLKVTVALLIPNGDKLGAMRWEIPVFFGPEHDVLTRYVDVARQGNYDFIVRITSDCPEVPSPLISKHIFTAANHSLDYTTNAMTKCRTYPDGFDVQVLSARLLEWLNDAANHVKYREHVANLLEDHRPDWIKIGQVVGYTDNSHLKISVDTQEDLEFVRMYVDLLQSKIDYAKNNSEILVRW
jgi:spore coat polysaccharide biosynthesis protein SpsF